MILFTHPVNEINGLPRVRAQINLDLNAVGQQARPGFLTPQEEKGG